MQKRQPERLHYAWQCATSMTGPACSVRELAVPVVKFASGHTLIGLYDTQAHHWQLP